MCNLRGYLVITYFQYGINFKYDLILALRSQIFEYLREPLHRHALEAWTPARSEK